MIEVRLHGSRVIAAEELKQTVDQSQQLQRQYELDGGPSRPDIPPHLMDEILELANKPRTTMNTLRMNKLLKRAGLESSFGKHKGRL